MSGLMIKTLAQYLTDNNNKMYGGSNMKNKGDTQIMIFMLALISIFIKGLIVYLGYNLLMPKVDTKAICKKIINEGIDEIFSVK